MSGSPSHIAAALRRAVSTNDLWVDTVGHSMGTAVVTGDQVLVKASPGPRQGEMWAFCNAEGAIVVHRSRGRRGEGWLFEGDAVGRADPVVPSSWLVGRVVSIRHGEEVRSVTRNDRVRGALAIVGRRARRALRRNLRRYDDR